MSRKNILTERYKSNSTDNISSNNFQMPNIDLRNYYLADFKFEKLQEQIRLFQENLSDEYDTLALLAPYLNKPIKITHITYQNPDLLYFYGYLEGNKIQIIQHTSQLNFMLIAYPKAISSKEPNRIGFDVNNNDTRK